MQTKTSNPQRGSESVLLLKAMLWLGWIAIGLNAWWVTQ